VDSTAQTAPRDLEIIYELLSWVTHGFESQNNLAACLGGSQVLGVVPKALAKGDIIGKIIGEELHVSTMSDRLNAMFNYADAFIALPGDLGTLEEIFHISLWAQLHIHYKPIGLLNVNGFYDNLLSFFDQAVEQEFLTFST
jgi:hypothetical protein